MGKKEKKTHREPVVGRFVGGYTQCDIEASTASLSYGVIGRVEAKVGRRRGRWNWRREWKTEEGEGEGRDGGKLSRVAVRAEEEGG